MKLEMEILYLACKEEKILPIKSSCTLIDRKSRLTFTDKNLEKTLEMLFSFDPKDYIVRDEPLNIKALSASCHREGVHNFSS